MARFIFATLPLLPLSLLAHAPPAPEPVLHPLNPQLSVLDAATGRVQVTVKAKIDSAGDLTMRMRIPSYASQNRPQNTNVTLEYSQENLTAGSTYSQNFVVHLPRNGLFLLNFDYEWEVASRSRMGSIPVYVVMSAGGIFQRTNNLIPAESFVRERSKVTHELPAPKPTDVANPIQVQIKGKVRYYNPNSPYTDKYEPVPGVKVHLDWDRDRNTRTAHVPPGHPADAAVTNASGDYEYNFTIPSTVNASYYHRIRIYAEKSNAATHPTARKGSLVEKYHADQHFVFSATDGTNSFKSTTANIDGVETVEGMVLRHSYRAREFAVNDLQETPGAVAYVIDRSHPNHPDPNRRRKPRTAFCSSAQYKGCQVYQELPTMEFAPDARSVAVYHEFGHWFEQHLLGGPFPYASAGQHGFLDITNDTVAWSEGFAEWFAAAGHTYWYARELPAKPEYHRYMASIWSWVFLEHAQNYLTTAVTDRKHNEGAIAVFLYNLWDGVERRAPGYEGDNEDVQLAGRKILDAVKSRRHSNPSGSLKRGSSIASFKYEARQKMGAHELSSFDALYEWIIKSGIAARPASPTSLTVQGDYDSRVLNWNDNTSPSLFNWDYMSLRIVNNDEDGFRIYRKVAPEEESLLLNTYPLVGEVGAGVTTWTDPADLETGTYAYIVTAYNAGGSSAPKLVAEISVETPPVSLTGPDEIAVNENVTGSIGQYEAEITGTGTVEWLSLAGDDASLFSLAQVGTSANQRSLSFNNSPDYEDPKDNGNDNTYEVIVEAQLQGNASTKVSRPVEIMVEDVQDTDRPGSLSLSNTSPNPRVGTRIEATVADLDNPQLSSAVWSWTSNTGGASGKALQGNTYDPSILDIGNTITASVTYTDDYGSHTLTETTTEVLSSLNLPGAPGNPRATGGDSEVTFSWTAAAHNGSPITHYEYAYRLASSPEELDWDTAPGPDGMNSKARSVTVTDDLTNDLTYRFFVRAHNSNGSGTSATADATPTDGNSAPTVSCPETASRAENGSEPWSVTDCTATDPDGDELTWTVIGTHGAYFKITGSGATRQLEFSNNPNYEHRASYSIVVKVTDPGSLSGQDGLTVSLTDVNEQPSVDCPETPSRNENGSSPWKVTECSASDPDGDILTWDTEGDQGDYFRFTGSGNSQDLEFKSNPNYEHRASYAVTAVVSDPGGLKGKDAITVTVNNVNEAGRITLSPSTPMTCAHVNATLEDVDGGINTEASASPPSPPTFTYGWEWDPPSAGPSGSSGTSTTQSYLPANSSVGQTVRVTVRYGDRASDRNTATLTSAAVAANTPRTPTGLNSTAGDRQVSLSWKAPNNCGSTITGYRYWYRKTSQTAWEDSGGAAGLSVTVPGLDNGVPYRFEIRAVNGAGRSRAEAIDETPVAPCALSLSGAKTGPVSYAENGTGAVDTYTVTRSSSCDASLQFTWSRAGTDASAFGLTGTGSSRSLSFNSAPNFEVKSSYSVTVQVTDGSASASRPVTVTVTNADDAGVVTLDPGTPKVGEHVTATLTDEDGGITGPTWSWSSGSAAAGQASSVQSYRYTVPASDVGKRLEASVSYTDNHGSGKSASGRSTGTVQANTPKAPPSFRAVRGNAQVALSWGAADGRGADVDRYDIRRAGGGWTAVPGVGSARDTTVTGLTNGTSYTFEVRAHNSEGDGAASSASATPATVPGAPTNLATDRQGGNGFMELTWGEAPANGSPVLHYYYRYKKTSDEDWRGWYRRAGGADARSKSWNNFDDGASYVFQVRARNDVGYGTTAQISAAPLGPGGTADDGAGGDEETEDELMPEGEVPEPGEDEVVVVAKPVAIDGMDGLGAAGSLAVRPAPNPFNPSTTLHFQLPEAAPVTLTVYNVAGQVVAELARGEVLEAGLHAREWHGTDERARPLASGLYLYRLIAGGHVRVGKIALIR